MLFSKGPGAERSGIIRSPDFLVALVVLLLNDLFMKALFANMLTGKLSDFAGVYVFALFWIAVLPFQRWAILASVALLFIFWKSESSQPLIDFINSSSRVQFGRVVDYSDLIALLVLPLAYYRTYDIRSFTLRIHPAFVICVCSFAFMATSKAPSRKEKPVYSLQEMYSVSWRNADSVLAEVRRLGLQGEIRRRGYGDHLLVISPLSDTIAEAKLSLYDSLSTSRKINTIILRTVTLHRRLADSLTVEELEEIEPDVLRRSVERELRDVLH